MPLVVPVLRFFVVFLNVYETFKTLKPPPPSARRGGQPSARAMTQRKRDLKGCLAVWVVWCCYAAYERTFDRVVGIFLPFYSEIKSVFLLFLVLTRAKGAEPLFLHVLRPLVKPYTAVVDPMLELSRDMGDFFFALLQVPLDYILSSPWFPSRCTGKLEEEPESSSSSCMSSADSGGSTRTNHHSSMLAEYNSAVQTSRVPTKRHGSLRTASGNQFSNGRSSAINPIDSRASRDRHSSSISLPAYSEYPPHDPLYSQTLPGYNGQPIWYSTYPTSGFEAPSSPDLPRTAPEYHSPEWRTYPAFPSAYPPTPLPPSAALPSLAVTRQGNEHRLVTDSAYPPIPEDEQGFGETLEKAHEGYPGLVHSSSNTNKIPPGVNSREETSNTTRQPDEDAPFDDSLCNSEAGLSEDDFGTSLRTPHRPPEAIPSSAYSSVDSLISALTTTDNASPLRTKISSDSLSSGSSSLAGRKRAHGAPQRKSQSTIPTFHSRNATLRGKPALPQSSLSEDEDASGVGDNGNTKVKRQRVLDPFQRKSTVRPAARVLGNTRKGVSSKNLSLRNRAVTTVSRGTGRTRTGSTTVINSTIRGRKQTSTSRQVVHNGPQGVNESSSLSSSKSGTLKGRAY